MGDSGAVTDLAGGDSSHEERGGESRQYKGGGMELGLWLGLGCMEI